MIFMNFYDWHRQSFHTLADHPFKSFLLLLVVVAFIAALIWAAVKHSVLNTILAAVLGMFAVAFAHSVLSGISWSSLLWVVVAVIATVALWALTVVTQVPDKLKAHRVLGSIPKLPKLRLSVRRTS
jgi:hypothetical protein